MNQRWLQGRDSYRPAGETIRTSEYEVAAVRKASAETFVVEHHYSHEVPAMRFNYGLFRHGQLAGVAVFSEPMNSAVLTNIFPCDKRDAAELGRFVLLDEVPGNGESWFLARAFELLKREHGIRGVVSFSDPLPRRDSSGRIVLPGHIGTIYQSFNGVYLGRSKRRILHVLPDGTVFSDRAASKIRALERNWSGPVEKLISFGADPFTPADPARWLEAQLDKVTHRVSHSGNHRYAWAVDKRLRESLCRLRETMKAGPYPKTRDQEIA